MEDLCMTSKSLNIVSWPVESCQRNYPKVIFFFSNFYSGAGHGLSSILQMLLGFPEHFSERKDVESLIHKAVDYVLTCECSSGSYPSVPGEVRHQEDKLVHWCHGAPGVVYLLAKAYLTWKDEKYLQAMRRSANLIWHKGLLRKGPGICHGVAGNASLLDIYLTVHISSFFHSEQENSQSYVIFQVESWDQYQYLGNCPPTPPLTQH